VRSCGPVACRLLRLVVLCPTLKRIYKRGRRVLPTARPLPADRSLHEWRKQVKYLRYALEILAPLRAQKLTRLPRQAEQLTDSLGEAHDLAMLAQKARSFAKRNRVDLQHLLAIIDRRRARLTLDALSRGKRLYRDRPVDWERPLSRYWRRWQRGA
jgi:CHAD domain-containing protein